jgi:hypothetical protein
MWVRLCTAPATKVVERVWLRGKKGGGGLENSQKEWTTSAYVQRVSKIIRRLLLLAIM